ncbi:histone-like nucleoid-structuring protein Lsr2 [Luteipulveratus halotolerans]|uniref:Nucleoid-associated protein Lsr2 n=1 Tax=Luteipulveratus halotolerans TaxID=1631356 RepID=A0A0L6CE94_9MICO|nr:Lsr2 family protein [Luteipulveratus halotolerans]KNX35915.1 hypothetical protein VV01_21915 [Luteipulveratus halotolerans]
MAQKVQVLLIDDVDGSEAAESLTFGLDGVTYEIDLSASNADQMRHSFEGWIANARRVGGRKNSSRTSRRDELHKVREWARANGHTVSDRGRVSQDIQDAYDKAHR